MGITDIVTTDSWLTIYVQNEPFLQLLRDFFKDTKTPNISEGVLLVLFHRGGKIRTCNPLLPKED